MLELVGAVCDSVSTTTHEEAVAVITEYNCMFNIFQTVVLGLLFLKFKLRKMEGVMSRAKQVMGKDHGEKRGTPHFWGPRMDAAAPLTRGFTYLWF